MSFSAFVANVEGSEAPSSSTYTIFLPRTPPEAFISSIARTSASLTDFSLIAIEPVSEWSSPTFTSSEEDDDEPEDVSVPVSEAC